MAPPAASSPPPAAAPAAASRTPSSSQASLARLLLLPALVAAFAALWSALEPSAGASTAGDGHGARLAQNATLTDAQAAADRFRAPVAEKYASEIVGIETRQLLAPQAVECRRFEADGALAHVSGVSSATGTDRVLLMLNGQDEGVLVGWTREDACLYELARFAATALGADVHAADNGVRLFSQVGQPITSAEQLDELRVAHVLLDFQMWVWPGIEVGYKRVIDEVFTVTTQSLHPKVFTVENFFSQAEADAIIREGVDKLSRSPVDSPDAVDGYHSDRTSFTAFLDDSDFTRDFRKRTARLLRLPSPSFTERLQLVRYEVGQFFRQHEDYFDSKQFVPTQELAADEYTAWAKWAANVIDNLPDDTALPEQFRRGGNMFPNAEDKVDFQQALLTAFMEDARPVDFFFEHADLAWGSWIEENLERKATDIMGPLMRDRGYMLKHIIKSWEARAGNLGELKYSIPPRAVSGVTHYFRWIRWMKECIQNLLDADASVPDIVKPTGKLYPTYNMNYQNELVTLLLEEIGEQELANEFNSEWVDWIKQNRNQHDVLFEALRVNAKTFDLVLKAWTSRVAAAGGDLAAFAYDKPEHTRHFEPNRFATVFLYLNDCPEGGETVFPYSKERIVTGIEREGMKECSEGLAVPPTKLTASMFYSQTPDNRPDPASLHGGCPPAEGVKCEQTQRCCGEIQRV